MLGCSVLAACVFLLSKPSMPDFSRRSAERDIKNGQVRLITFGLGGPSPEHQQISQKYGFKEVGFGCEVAYSDEEKEYDDLIRRYLEERNGPDWMFRYRRELDSLAQVVDNSE